MEQSVVDFVKWGMIVGINHDVHACIVERGIGLDLMVFSTHVRIKMSPVPLFFKR